MKPTLRVFCAVMLILALALGCVHTGLADSVTMYVSTGNSGRLNLRSLPTVQSDSLGLYANGTLVTVESTQSGWAYVTVGGLKGYMMLSCLSYAAPVQPVPTSPAWAAATPVPTEDTTLYIQTGNTGKLHLREQPSTTAHSLGLYPNGTAVQVTARVGNFAFVRVGGMTGYMMQKFLAPAPGATAVPTASPATPAPFDPAAAIAMVVQTGNSGKLHLREQASTSSRSLGLYPNGTTLQAIPLGNGWARVQVGGVQGYMMTGFLAYVNAPTLAPTPTPNPALPTVVPTPLASPSPTPGPSTDVIMYVQTGNSGKLHLRENISTSSASLGLYPNGTAVTVHATIGNWYQVTVAGKNGYMMRAFLAAPAVTPTLAPGVTPAPTPVPPPPGSAVVTQPNNSFVNLRSRPHSEENNVIAKVPSGTVVEVLEKGDTWCKIRYNGIEGWMISWYLQ